MLGFLGAFVMTLGFALPALLSSPPPRWRACRLRCSPSATAERWWCRCSAARPGISPAASAFAFLPIALSALPLLIVPPMIRFNRTRGHGIGVEEYLMPNPTLARRHQPAGRAAR